MPKTHGQARDVPAAAERVKDARATQWWDEQGVTLKLFQSALQIPEDAWDVYLLYAPGLRWEGEIPPKPSFWMHQLGRSKSEPRVNGPFLDGPELERQARVLLKRSR